MERNLGMCGVRTCLQYVRRQTQQYEICSRSLTRSLNHQQSTAVATDEACREDVHQLALDVTWCKHCTMQHMARRHESYNFSAPSRPSYTIHCAFFIGAITRALPPSFLQIGPPPSVSRSSSRLHARHAVTWDLFSNNVFSSCYTQVYELTCNVAASTTIDTKNRLSTYVRQSRMHSIQYALQITCSASIFSLLNTLHRVQWRRTSVFLSPSITFTQQVAGSSAMPLYI